MTLTFGQTISICLLKYTTFIGRATRLEYWRFFLFAFLTPLASSIVSELLAALFLLAVLMPFLAVSARRLHDTDRSGWFLLLWMVPIVGWIILMAWAAQDSREPNRFQFTE